ncbi:MAG: hypothetical protein SWK76_11170 [Actinomycetota bacterium]|nr:hypothetical protein [Actinomycetota bacterium]
MGFDIMNPLASVIIFQYNPETMNRSLTVKAKSNEGKTSEVTRLEGAPEETIKLDIEIDATDQLEKADGVATKTGIYPQLSALEMLIYPKTTSVIANTALMEAGTMEIVPTEAPLTLFIWGVKRVVPVRLTQFSIEEEAYDTRLNPIIAKVSLSMSVLSYNELPASHPGYYVFMAHQMTKEAMAVIGSAESIGSIGGGIGF